MARIHSEIRGHSQAEPSVARGPHGFLHSDESSSKLSMTERIDEERSLMGDQKKSYGVHSSSGQLQGVRRSWRQTPSGYSSRAGSDNEDDESLFQPPRHKRPPLSTLSSFMNTRHSDTPNLVLPALDPR